MDPWTNSTKRKFKPKYTAAIEDFNKNTPKRLQAMREGVDPHNRTFKAKISQRNLAQIADMLPQNYNKIERGKIKGQNNPTAEQLIKLSIIYDCSLDYLILGKENVNMRPLEDPEVAKILREKDARIQDLEKLKELLTAENERLKKSKR